MIHQFDDALVTRLFPFHMVLDSELRIVSHGDSLAKIDPSVREHPMFGDLFAIHTPRVDLNLEVFQGDGAVASQAPGDTPATEGAAYALWAVEGASPTSATYVLEHKQSSLQFRMQMLVSQSPQRIAFVGSPLLTSPNQLDRYDLTLSDFAPFDFVLDYLVALRLKDSLIEEKTQLANELEQANRDLEKQVKARQAADESKDLFLTSMSHEIRTPMNAITGLTSLLLQMEQAADRRQHLSTIDVAANALRSLIDGILEFSAIESGALERTQADFDLHDVITQAVRLFRPTADAKGIELRGTVDDEVPRAVRGEVDLFNRVIINLTENAIKFTDSGSVEITVTAKPGPRGVLVRVEVEDTGVGIDPADHTRIFERFTQLRGADAVERSGSGLGLEISRKICETCGGSLGLESTLEQGSLFWFEFPFETRDEVPSKNVKPDRSEWTEKLSEAFDTTLPILVVDDNEINRSMVMDMIAWLGIEPESAKDGETAIAMVSEREFGAILMDIRMPGMDGYQATRVIRERGGDNAETPIIGLSANAFSKDREAGLAAGMSNYLAKPITMATLVNVLGDPFNHGSALNPENASPAASAGTLESEPSATEPIDFIASSPLLETGDSSRAIEFLQDFLAAAPATIARFRTSLDKEDFEEVSRQAHSLRGSSLFLGIDPLNDLTQQLEENAQRRDAKDAASVLVQIEELVAEILASFRTPTASTTKEDPRGSR